MVNAYEVDLETLRDASSSFYRGSDAVGDAAAFVGLTQINPQALGEVAAADEFASALDDFVSRHTEDLRHGSMWVNDAADGLARTVEEYQRTEDGNSRGLANAGGDR